MMYNILLFFFSFFLVSKWENTECGIEYHRSSLAYNIMLFLGYLLLFLWMESWFAPLLLQENRAIKQGKLYIITSENLHGFQWYHLVNFWEVLFLLLFHVLESLEFLLLKSRKNLQSDNGQESQQLRSAKMETTKEKTKWKKKKGRENRASPSVWIWKKDRNGKLKKKKKRTEEGFRERTYWQVTTFIKELFLVD